MKVINIGGYGYINVGSGIKDGFARCIFNVCSQSYELSMEIVHTVIIKENVVNKFATDCIFECDGYKVAFCVDNKRLYVMAEVYVPD